MTTQTVGERVRTARKIAGLTQLQLTDRAHMSLSLVKKVEQGTTPAGPAFIAACARVLGLGAADLTSQPYPVQSRDQHKVHSVIPALRHEIAAYLLPSTSEVAPRSIRDLVQAVEHASVLRQSAGLDQLGVELPPLLAELRAAAHHHEGVERERVYGLLAEAYAAAGQVAYKLGYADLSSLTTERVAWAAARSGDPLAMAAADFYRAGELIATAEWRGALDHLDTARDAFADRLSTDDEAALAMHGVLHVKFGLAAARAGDADLSDAHLAEAQHAARHVTRGSDHRARQIAPLQTRYHPQVRETVATLAETDRRRTDTLSGFARWVGLTGAARTRQRPDEVEHR